jgi:hypothetical protein
MRVLTDLNAKNTTSGQATTRSRIKTHNILSLHFPMQFTLHQPTTTNLFHLPVNNWFWQLDYDAMSSKTASSIKSMQQHSIIFSLAWKARLRVF